MEMINLTFKFNGVFPTQQSFLDYCATIDLFETPPTEIQTFLNFVYNSLKYKFGVVNIAYDSIEDFKSELALVLSDTVNQYYKQVDLIKKVYLFDNEEFSATSQSIISEAEQNNKQLDDPAQWLGFVGKQQFNQQSLSKFQGYIQAIRQMPSYDRLLFTNKYKYLFETISTYVEYRQY